MLSALSIVAGWLWSRMDDMPRKDEDERFIDESVRQACKRYVGRVMSSRRQWQRLQARRRRRPQRRTAHAIKRLQGGVMRGASAQQRDVTQPQLSFSRTDTASQAVNATPPSSDARKADRSYFTYTEAVGCGTAASRAGSSGQPRVVPYATRASWLPVWLHVR